LTAKRDELHAKHEDAKDLKEGIDRRSQQVASFLRKYLTQDEFTDYEYFIKMKSQLTIEQQEIEDRIKQSEEQLTALHQSMQNR
jgi:protein Shroom